MEVLRWQKEELEDQRKKREKQKERKKDKLILVYFF